MRCAFLLICLASIPRSAWKLSCRQAAAAKRVQQAVSATVRGRVRSQCYWRGVLCAAGGGAGALLSCACIKITLSAGLLLALVTLPTCSNSTPASVTPSVPQGRSLEFEYLGPDDARLAATQLRGRVTLLLLLTTHDLGSQLMARQAQELLRRFVPRINAAAIVMEAPQYGSLVPLFKQGLELSYPVVMADAALLSGRGPFGEVGFLPTSVVLDRQGRESERIVGGATMAQLEAALRRAGAN
jgi:hypothetical protein